MRSLLNRHEIDALLPGVPGWRVDRSVRLERSWSFSGLEAAAAFLRRLDGLSLGREDVTLSGSSVRVLLGASGGLLRADFALARKVSAAARPPR
ncbi:MAG: 4a-hydroxytetrahydrobiopterin dehydratase [Elusimicrobiota bacterium]|jgi:pterin-4a-carbinolamine dehydratase